MIAETDRAHKNATVGAVPTKVAEAAAETGLGERAITCPGQGATSSERRAGKRGVKLEPRKEPQEKEEAKLEDASNEAKQEKSEVAAEQETCSPI